MKDNKIENVKMLDLLYKRFFLNWDTLLLC